MLFYKSSTILNKVLTSDSPNLIERSGNQPLSEITLKLAFAYIHFYILFMLLNDIFLIFNN